MASTPAVLLLLVLLAFAHLNAGASEKKAVVDKNDPATRQEYLQVKDAHLSAAVCQQHVHAHAKDKDSSNFCIYLRAAVGAFSKLGFTRVDVYDCAALHHGSHHAHANRSHAALPVVCEHITYAKVADARIDQADVFLMIGNSFVPSLPASSAGNHRDVGSYRHSKSRARLYLHTGASHHMHALQTKKPSQREQHAAVRNLGAYDQVLFVSPLDRRHYFDLMYPLFR